MGAQRGCETESGPGGMGGGSPTVGGWRTGGIDEEEKKFSLAERNNEASSLQCLARFHF